MFKIPKQEYTAEFKELAVKRAKSGETVGTVARGEQAGPLDRGAPASGYGERGFRRRYRHRRGLRHGLTGAGGEASAQGGMRGEHAGVVMLMPVRWRDQCGESVEQLERGEGGLGLATGQRLGRGVADRLRGTVPGEPLAGEGGAGAVATPQLQRQRCWCESSWGRRTRNSAVRRVLLSRSWAFPVS